MKRSLIRTFFLFLFCGFILKAEPIQALIPYYYFPSKNSLEKESLSIGRSAYQLLYFGQIKDSLNLAKLAVKINKSNEKLWLILSEAQIANKLDNDALISLIEAQKINPEISEIYFAKSSIYLKQLRLQEAKQALESGLKLEPDNHRAIFQLGNIFLMKKDYFTAIKFFDSAIKIKPDFWQAINNKGLAYFEQNKIGLSIQFFEQAISIEENAESLLGLAACLREKDINSALELTKKALNKNPNYADFEYRKEQLWGEKIQISTEKLFKNDQLRKLIKLAKSRINETS